MPSAAAKRPSRATSSRASTNRRSAAAADRIQVQLTRLGHVGGRDVRDHQGRDARQPAARRSKIAYLLENLPADLPLHFAVELNFSGLPVRRRRSLLPRRPAATGWASSAGSSI